MSGLFSIYVLLCHFDLLSRQEKAAEMSHFLTMGKNDFFSKFEEVLSIKVGFVFVYIDTRCLDW